MTNPTTATDLSALAAVTSPAWLPSLHDASVVFAEWLPILGGVWIIIQIILRLTAVWQSYQAYRQSKKNPGEISG